MQVCMDNQKQVMLLYKAGGDFVGDTAQVVLQRYDGRGATSLCT